MMPFDDFDVEVLAVEQSGRILHQLEQHIDCQSSCSGPSAGRSWAASSSVAFASGVCPVVATTKRNAPRHGR